MMSLSTEEKCEAGRIGKTMSQMPLMIYTDSDAQKIMQSVVTTKKAICQYHSAYCPLQNKQMRHSFYFYKKSIKFF
jgi:hypothetical protein